MLHFQALVARLLGQLGQPSSKASRAQVHEARTFSPEIWLNDRQAFIFCCENQRFGDRATFCVPQAALQALGPKNHLEPSAAFDALRPVIYRAALERMRVASAMFQHVLTADQLWASQPQASNPLPR